MPGSVNFGDSVFNKHMSNFLTVSKCKNDGSIELMKIRLRLSHIDLIKQIFGKELKKPQLKLIKTLSHPQHPFTPMLLHMGV